MPGGCHLPEIYPAVLGDRQAIGKESPMSDLAAACARLIAVVGERADKTAPVVLGGHEWEAFVTAVGPPVIQAPEYPVDQGIASSDELPPEVTPKRRGRY